MKLLKQLYAHCSLQRRKQHNATEAASSWSNSCCVNERTAISSHQYIPRTKTHSESLIRKICFLWTKGKDWHRVMSVIIILTRRVHNPSRQVAKATEFCSVVPNVCKSSVSNLLHVTFLSLEVEGGPYILWKIWAPLPYRIFTLLGWQIWSSDIFQSPPVFPWRRGMRKRGGGNR